MLSNKELIEQLLQNVKSDITQDMTAKNFSASGKTITSFEIVADDSTGSLAVPAHFLTLVQDREDGGKGRRNAPVSIEGREGIKQWIQSRGFSYDIPIDSLVYLIARKLKEKGNRIYQGLVKGIELKPIFKNNLDLFARELTDRFEEGLRKALWLLVFACCLTSCITSGVTYSKGVYQSAPVQNNDPRNYIIGFSTLIILKYGNDHHTKTSSKRRLDKQ
jgi:hypothetical protein